MYGLHGKKGESAADKDMLKRTISTTNWNDKNEVINTILTGVPIGLKYLTGVTKEPEEGEL